MQSWSSLRLSRRGCCFGGDGSSSAKKGVASWSRRGVPAADLEIIAFQAWGKKWVRGWVELRLSRGLQGRGVGVSTEIFDSTRPSCGDELDTGLLAHVVSSAWGVLKEASELCSDFGVWSLMVTVKGDFGGVLSGYMGFEF